MTTSTILYQQHDHVGVVQLNRPEKLNALSEEMLVALNEILEALRIGLVSTLAGSDELRSKAEALAQEIAQLAPLAIRACIQAVTRGLELPLDQGLSLETELFTRLFATKDMREGTLAFLEKRLPAFKGR